MNGFDLEVDLEGLGLDLNIDLDLGNLGDLDKDLSDFKEKE